MMVKLIPIFTSLPCYYLVKKKKEGQVSLTVVGSRLLVLRTPPTEKFRANILALGLQVSECFDKIPVRIFLDVLFRVLGFS